jgi:hypothetical protein
MTRQGITPHSRSRASTGAIPSKPGARLRPDEHQSLAMQRVRGTLETWPITLIRFPPVWLTLTR